MPLLNPSSGLVLTVDQYLQQPAVISQDILNLTVQQLIADRIFTRGSADQVRGGVARYGYDFESMFTDRDAEEVALRSEFPRTGITSVDIRSEIVRQYGLEVPFNYVTLRRNAIDEFLRAELKLANTIVKFIDTKAMAAFAANTDVLTMAASADWTVSTTNVLRDVATAQDMIDAQEKGYVGNTLLAHTQYRVDLIDRFGNALLQRGLIDSVSESSIANFLNLQNIYFSRRVVYPAGTTTPALYMLNSGVVGTIADEVPEAREQYSSYTPPNNSTYGPIYVRTYENENKTGIVLRAGRWPAMFITDPKSVVRITGA